MRTPPVNFVVCAVLIGGLLASAAAIACAHRSDEIWYQRYSSTSGATEAWPRIVSRGPNG